MVGRTVYYICQLFCAYKLVRETGLLGKGEGMCVLVHTSPGGAPSTKDSTVSKDAIFSSYVGEFRKSQALQQTKGVSSLQFKSGCC